LANYGASLIEEFRNAAKGYLALDEDGQFKVNKKAQLPSQMFTCFNVAITDEW